MSFIKQSDLEDFHPLGRIVQGIWLQLDWVLCYLKIQCRLFAVVNMKIYMRIWSGTIARILNLICFFSKKIIISVRRVGACSSKLLEIN